MPRLPRIMAETGVAQANSPRIPYSAGSGSGQIGAALGNVSKELSRFADLERQKRDLATKQEISLEAAEIEKEVVQGDSDLKLTISDPDAYREAHEKMVNTIIDRRRQNAKNGETAAALDAKMAGFVGRQKAEAYKYANDLYKQRATAQLLSTLDTREQLAGLAKDDTVFEQQRKEAEAAIDAAVPFIGEEKAGALKRQFRDATLEARAVREQRNNPEGFLATAESRYADLDAKKRQDLVKTAGDKIEADRIARVKEAEKQQKVLDDIGEKNRQWNMTGLDIAASNRELTQGQVERAREEGLIVTPEEVRHYLTLAKKGTAIESDQALWSEVQSDVWSEKPTYNEAKIRKLMVRAVEGGQGLSGEHGRMALTELNRKREAASDKGQTQENEQRRLANDAYNKAKEEGLMGLGITTPMAQLDEKRGALAFDFVREFNARVMDPSGNVRTDVQHRQVMVEVLPTFLARKSSDTRLTYQQQGAVYKDLTGSQVPEVMDPAFLQWYAKEVKAAEALGADPKTLNLYRLRSQQLLQIQRSRTEYLNNEARKTSVLGGSGGSKSTGGYTAPKENKPGG